ncbi:MAG: hypothetical protein RLZZ350_570 [Verrucomicrobiota bacterium]
MKLVAALLLCVLGLGCDPRSVVSVPTSRLERATRELKKAKNQDERFYALGDAAKESFDAGLFFEARKYAEELAALTLQYSKDWNYGNAIQDANIVFGRLAVRDGKITEAKNFLLLAGKSPGSPQMDSFGPNMSLAKDLLQHGESEVVLEYFELCKKFWDGKFSTLDAWRDEVKAGRIPEFGANLFY